MSIAVTVALAISISIPIPVSLMGCMDVMDGVLVARPILGALTSVVAA